MDSTETQWKCATYWTVNCGTSQNIPWGDRNKHSMCIFGWFQKLKEWYGRYLCTSGVKASSDNEASHYFVDEITKLITNRKIHYDLIYNSNKTSLFWRYVPRKTFATTEEKNPTGIKDMKEQMTILVCGNA